MPHEGRGCKDVARRLYDRVLQVYVGSVYSSLRERAVSGIDDPQTSGASTAQDRVTFFRYTAYGTP